MNDLKVAGVSAIKLMALLTPAGDTLAKMLFVLLLKYMPVVMSFS